MKFSTKAIHVGQEPDKETGAMIPPVYLTSTFKQDYPADLKFGIYDYTRAYNPNFTNLETTLASLEQAQYATVFSSGLGALTALFSTLSPGDKVLAVDDMYGGTYRLLDKFFKKFGISFSLIDMQDLRIVEEALGDKPKMLLLESPTNPFLKIADIAGIARLAKAAGVTTVVDNTFASPYLQNPISLGIDVVVHSTTKYIGGHSDLIGGVVISNNKALKEQMEYHRKVIGVNPSPFDAWLTSRGIKTLAVRMEKHNENALKIATYLEKHKKVKKVYYPWLPSHKNYDIAKKQMRGGSGIVSVEFAVSIEAAKKLITSFTVITLAESLGGVESLVDHPASMTHAGIPAEQRKKLGLTDGLIRFSIGIEDVDDLIADIEQALHKVK